MNIPEGGKFVFFIVPVFAVTIILILVFFSKKNDIAIDVNNLEDINTQEEIYGSESDTDEEMDFEELKVETTTEGTGKETEAGDEVSVHYILSLRDGTEIENSYDSGKPFPFVLGIGQVIKGWDQGIVGMKVGEKRRLEIPSSLAYGETGSGPISGDTGLIFETELVSIN